MTNQIVLAGCIISDTESRILLLHRNTPKRVQWEIPGGKIDDGETMEEAAEREVGEELGVRVALRSKLGTKAFQEDGHTMTYNWFAADVLDGTPTIAEPTKYDDLRYFTIQQLRAMQDQLSPNTQNFLAELQAGAIPLWV